MQEVKSSVKLRLVDGHICSHNMYYLMCIVDQHFRFTFFGYVDRQ